MHRCWWVVPLAVVAALAAGPPVGEPAPALRIDAVNDGDRGQYCVIDDAEGRPCVVYMLDAFAAQDEGNQKVAALLDTLYKEYHEQGVCGAVIVPGAEEYRAELQAFCEMNQVKVPVAPIAYDNEDFKAWKMEATAQSILVAIKEGKVLKVWENLTPETIRDAVEELKTLLAG